MNPICTALIQALARSPPPVQREFARQWSEAQLMNLLDDSLSADLAAASGRLDTAMHRRFLALADFAVGTGARAILFTCSAFGPCIDAVKRRHPTIPVFKPNEAMIIEAAALQTRIELAASFAPTLASMPAEFPSGIDIDCKLAEGALAAPDAGDTATHDRLVVDAAQRVAGRGYGAIALSQFSLARSADAVRATLQLPVLTTAGSAVTVLKARILGTEP